MMQSRKKSLETLDRNLKPCKKTKVGSGYWKHGELSCYTEASQRTRYLIWSLNLKLYTAYASQILTLSEQIPSPPIQVVGSQAIVRAGSRASVCTVVSSISPIHFLFLLFFKDIVGGGVSKGLLLITNSILLPTVHHGHTRNSTLKANHVRSRWHWGASSYSHVRKHIH